MCRLFRVRGRVQGVFFRVSTRDVALPLGLSGHAINLQDGSVEVNVCGGNVAVEDLLAWLANGPPMASVSAVDEIETACSQPEQFKIA